MKGRLTLAQDPTTRSTQAAFDQLVAVMAALRGENGCPWDKEQTHESLKKYLIEEAYEVIDAIDQGDMGSLCEELGDVLLQVVFHAQLAAEAATFTAEDVVRSITSKLIRRHPHVFGDRSADNADDVREIWQAVKAKENAQKPSERARESLMDGIPRHFPALMYAAEVGKRAARVGFDWPSADAVWQKVAEERAELEEVLAQSTTATERIEEEWGDLVFSLVNLARHLKLEPEAAMRKAARKFEQRFRGIEQLAHDEGKPLQQRMLSEMDALWDRVKDAPSP